MRATCFLLALLAAGAAARADAAAGAGGDAFVIEPPQHTDDAPLRRANALRAVPGACDELEINAWYASQLNAAQGKWRDDLIGKVNEGLNRAMFVKVVYLVRSLFFNE